MNAKKTEKILTTIRRPRVGIMLLYRLGMTELRCSDSKGTEGKI